MKKIKITMEEWIMGLYENTDPFPEGGVTVRDFAKVWGISERTTRGRLSKLIEDKKIKKFRCVVNGKMTNVYTEADEGKNVKKRNGKG